MYNGLEIDMLSVGNADCILVSRWVNDVVFRVLIDGGNKGNAPMVRHFLRNQGINKIDDLLSTHHHDDHSSGLLDLLGDETLEFGMVWSHVPQFHVQIEKVRDALKAAGSSLEAENVRKTVDTAAEIYNLALTRRIPHTEPFKGNKLAGFLEVCSPTVEFYEGLVSEFTNVEKIKAEDAAELRYKIQSAVETVFAKNTADGESTESSLLDKPHTAPENESSVVTGAHFNGKTYLFTSDAGTCALTNVVRDYAVKNLHWMQIPHHGSRRNVTKTLIDHFAPKEAWVSAEGTQKHPRRAVVNAFKDAGTAVYSTHYPDGRSLWMRHGSVPTRSGYSDAIALYDGEKLAKKSETDLSGLALLLGAK